MGEVLIFRRLRRGTVVPTFGGEVLRERHVRILWASWHVLTLLGWCMAAMLVALAAWPAGDMTRALARLVGLGMFAGAMTVLIATRGPPPRLAGHVAGVGAVDRSVALTRLDLLGAASVSAGGGSAPLPEQRR